MQRVGSLLRNIQAGKDGKQEALESITRAFEPIRNGGFTGISILKATQKQVVVVGTYDGSPRKVLLTPTFFGIQVQVEGQDERSVKKRLDTLFREAFQ